MLLAGKGLVDGFLDNDEARRLLTAGLEQLDLDGRRVLVLVPDDTRTCPLPAMFRHVVDILTPRVKKLDFLIALGTHQPLSQERINQLFGLTEEERTQNFANVGIFNHLWNQQGTFKKLGIIPAQRINEISDGLMLQDVPVGINKMILDYDHIMILGPTFPHEVVGFSGGMKYLFPGIGDWDFINFFHWLGAVITCINIIGTADTPVRQMIDEAAKLVPRPVTNLNMVVRDERLAGLFIGEPKEAWSRAAELSDKLHIVYKDKPYKTVLGICPEMYEDVWTGGKVMYKLEPIVADGGELIIYAPHITETSYTHKKELDAIGYHTRDYFLAQMDKFQNVPGGVMAHSTHVRGLGTFVDGVEHPRVTVTLATSIPKDRVEQISLNYCDWRSINIDDYRNREDESILVVDHAGEILHRLKDPQKHISLPN